MFNLLYLKLYYTIIHVQRTFNSQSEATLASTASLNSEGLGHVGETAIQTWRKQKYDVYLLKHLFIYGLFEMMSTYANNMQSIKHIPLNKIAIFSCLKLLHRDLQI